MTNPINDADSLRRSDAGLLARALGDLRRQTLVLFDATRSALGGRLDVPCLEVINPPLWEIGHVGWFEEFWIARNPERLRGAEARLEAPRAAPLLARADALYDSSRVPHARRWRLDLPDMRHTLEGLAQVRERTLALLRASAGDDESLYFFRLALMHEAMHREAGAMIAQVLGLDVGGALPDIEPRSTRAGGEIELAATALEVGGDEGGFAFDNELGPQCVELAALRIDRTPVTWAAYLPFVAAGGYDEARWWTPAGWAWRRVALPGGLPRYLARGDDGSLHRDRFGRATVIDPAQPAVHLSLHEAQAWCAWAGRRLPTEFEWMHAATQAGDAFDWGQVWEWTASPFAPWPGFAPHPYRDYSMPWFDGRPVLKGGSFASLPWMKHPRYRNFFTAGRNDVFAGFRSCAIT